MLTGGNFENEKENAKDEITEEGYNTNVVLSRNNRQQFLEL